MADDRAPPSSFDSDPLVLRILPRSCQLTEVNSEFFDEGWVHKLVRKIKEEPLIPLGRSSYLLMPAKFLI